VPISRVYPANRRSCCILSPIDNKIGFFNGMTRGHNEGIIEEGYPPKARFGQEALVEKLRGRSIEEETKLK